MTIRKFSVGVCFKPEDRILWTYRQLATKIFESSYMFYKFSKRLLLFKNRLKTSES